MKGIQVLVVGDYQANCYLVTDGSEPHLLIIDAGDDAAQIIRTIESQKLQPQLLVSTHCHIDHIGGNRELKERYPTLKICAHPDDAAGFSKPLRNLSLLQGRFYKSPPAEVLLEDGMELTIGTLRLRVLHTPGHTPGGISLFCAEGLADRPVVFTGDALFAGGIGRCDFPGGDGRLLVRSIREKLLTLPPQTIVLPGHGPESTIGEEKDNNPFLN